MSRNIEINPKLNSITTNDFPEIIFSGLTDSYAIRLQVDDNGTVNYNGTYGTLFTVSDNKTGLLHSVNDISGLPILQVYSWDYVQLGTWNKYALNVASDKVGIGITAPSTKFHIFGTNSSFRLQDGSEAAGYVLTSDVNGNATWTSSVAGGVTLNNNTNNYIATMTGTSSTLDGESDLVFDATTSTFYQDSTVTGHSYVHNPLHGITSLIDTSNFTLADLNMWNGETIRADFDLSISSQQTFVGFGQIMFLSKTPGGSPVWDLANAHNSQTKESINMLGLALETTTGSTGSIDILLKGWVCYESSALYNIFWDLGQIGNPLYLMAEDVSGPTMGWGGASWDTSVGFTLGDTIRKVGYYYSDSSVGPGISIVRFNPSSDWIT